jgi:hypothetical protein
VCLVIKVGRANSGRRHAVKQSSNRMASVVSSPDQCPHEDVLATVCATVGASTASTRCTRSGVLVSSATTCLCGATLTTDGRILIRAATTVKIGTLESPHQRNGEKLQFVKEVEKKSSLISICQSLRFALLNDSMQSSRTMVTL